MSQMLEVQTDACPFLRPGLSSGRSAPSVAIYCALPGRRVRVPDRYERRVYCDASNFSRCPVYQNHVTVG